MTNDTRHNRDNDICIIGSVIFAMTLSRVFLCANMEEQMICKGVPLLDDLTVYKKYFYQDPPQMFFQTLRTNGVYLKIKCYTMILFLRFTYWFGQTAIVMPP